MKKRRATLAALCFLLPNFLGFLLFTFWPVIASLVLSFASWDLLSPPRWVGLENFVDLLGFHRDIDGWTPNDADFWRFTGNTFALLLGLPLTMACSLSLAILLNQKIKFTYVYRLIFFLPGILSGVAMFYLWKWVYNPDYGLFNVMLGHLGIEGPKWLTSVTWAKPAIILMSLWLHAGGQGMLLYLAALQGVSTELYEAAEIDGANAWQKFRTVTWPSIAPVTFFIFVMGVIGGLQGGFEAAYILTGGGPDGSTTTIGYYIYTKAYEQFEMGYAAAIAWILFLLVLGVTLLNWRFGRKNTMN